MQWRPILQPRIRDSSSVGALRTAKGLQVGPVMGLTGINIQTNSIGSGEWYCAYPSAVCIAKVADL